ncbi:MAG: SpoIIE family protein phosphatase [Blastocatellia bacterium]|nr:SpoIIE family protein phosphatase [Blastocatellia bacterium]
MTKGLRLVGLLGGVFFFAVMLIHIGANFYEHWIEHKAYSRPGWEAKQVNGKPVIYTVDSDGPATALRTGDEVVSLTIDPQNACPLMNKNECTVPPGTHYHLTIRRGTEELEFVLATSVKRLSSRLIDFAFDLFRLIFVITGLTVLLLKPGDKQVWVLALMLVTFTGIISTNIAFIPGWTQIISRLARTFGIVFLPLFLHFFLVFPRRGLLARRFPRLEYWIYLPFLALILPLIAVENLGGYEMLGKIPGIEFLGITVKLLFVIYLIAGLAVMVVNYRAADNADRHRTRVILVGCSAGILSLLLLFGGQSLGVSESHPGFFELLLCVMLVAMPLVPLSISYAIIRHQVIPISILMRRGVRYLLVSRGSILLELITGFVVVTGVLTYIIHRAKPSGMVIGLVSAGIAVAAWKSAEILHKRYLAPIIDRRFFRQSYDAQQIIAELTQSLRTVTDLRQLLELVATKIQSALQPVYVTIFLRDATTGEFNCAYSSNRQVSGVELQSPQGEQLVKYAQLIAQLDQLGEFLNRPDTGFRTKPESDNVKQVNIGPDIYLSGEDEASLLMPLISKEEVLGIISLGPRLGDLPFSREDRQLLMSASGPAALAVENARLVEKMIAEARYLQEIEVDHRRKTEELTFARQLQLSMLPARDVITDKVEIIGRMRTASEVGGDYFDFIELGDGRLCIAVGDATGHGMAAGLVVGMVKMGLINGLQRLNGNSGIKPMVEDLNSALKSSLTQRGMGMCLGAAILETSTLKVELFSNGMPSPYHYRAAESKLSQIVTQAPPLGFLRHVNVRPVGVELRPGDALLWLSDGFEERLDRMDQVWGSELVAQTLERICVEESSADCIARRMIAACDKAADGLSNHDDMTIVVAKVRE